MTLVLIKNLLIIISGLFALATGIVTAFWAYSKFILERGLVPATEANIELNRIGNQGDKVVLEILIHLKNVGTSTLIARNIRVDVRYLLQDNLLELFHKERAQNEQSETIIDVRFGKINFDHSLIKELRKTDTQDNFIPDSKYNDINDIKKGDEARGFRVIGHHTFVQPGVDQIYTFATALPHNTSFVLIYSSFTYEQHPKKFQISILRLCRRIGLIQYSLNHISQPHSIERVFAIKDQKVGQ